MTLLQQIKQTRDTYKRQLTMATMAKDDISIAECRLTKEKLSKLILQAKEEGLKGQVEFIAMEGRH